MRCRYCVGVDLEAGGSRRIGDVEGELGSQRSSRFRRANFIRLGYSTILEHDKVSLSSPRRSSLDASSTRRPCRPRRPNKNYVLPLQLVGKPEEPYGHVSNIACKHAHLPPDDVPVTHIYIPVRTTLLLIEVAHHTSAVHPLMNVPHILRAQRELRAIVPREARTARRRPSRGIRIPHTLLFRHGACSLRVRFRSAATHGGPEGLRLRPQPAAASLQLPHLVKGRAIDRRACFHAPRAPDHLRRTGPGPGPAGCTVTYSASLACRKL